MEGAGSGAKGGASTKEAPDMERASTSHSKSSNAVIQIGLLQSLCSILHACLLVSKPRASENKKMKSASSSSTTSTIMLISNHNGQAESGTAAKAEEDDESIERGGDGEDGEDGKKEGEEEEEGEAEVDFELPDAVTAGQVDRLLQSMSLEPERKHAAQDIFLALNNWAPAGQDSEPGDHDAWRQR